MHSPALWFGVLIIITGAVGGFFSEPASKGETWAKQGLFAIAVLNFVSGLYILVDAARNSDQQNKTLAEISAKQQTAITQASNLAVDLKAAQTTAAGIASDLSATSKTVDNVFTETKRVLQPLNGLGGQFVLNLPDDDPEVISALSSYRQQVNALPTPQLDPRVYSMEGPFKKPSMAFIPQNPIYPKPDTALGLIAQSYLVDMQFHLHHHPASAYVGDKKPDPDLAFEFVEDRSQPLIHLSRYLLAASEGHLMYVFISNATLDVFRSNGRVLSVADLLDCQVVAQPVFHAQKVDAASQPPDKSVLLEAQNIWSKVTLYSFVLSTEGATRLVFDIPHSTIVKQFGVPVFVGRFVRTARIADYQ